MPQLWKEGGNNEPGRLLYVLGLPAKERCKLTVDINGVEVHVEPGQEIYVVTSPAGDCVSTFTSSDRFESGLERGKWDDAFVYKLSVAKGLELLNQPMSHSEYVA